MQENPSLSYKASVVALVFFGIAALFLLVWHASSFFLLVFGGILFAVLISSLAGFLSRKSGLSYNISVVVVVLLLAAVIALAVWLLAPIVSEQTDQLINSFPQALQHFKERLSQTSWGSKLAEGIPEKPARYFSAHQDIWAQLTGFFSSTLSIAANLIIVIITGIYLAANPTLYRKGLVRLFAPPRRARIEQVLSKCYHTLHNWLISRSISMVVVGIATAIGLTLIGIPLAFVLAIIAALLNFIPNIGPYIALAPALLFAYLQGPDKALYVVLLYLGIQSLEGYILTPLLDKKFISMPPALLLFGQVLLGILVGIGGVFLASPLIAVTIVLVKELFVKDHLENRIQPFKE